MATSQISRACCGSSTFATRPWVCHDWGGPTGLGFALSNSDRVRALVIMSTWAWPLPPAEFHNQIFPWRMMRAPVVGPYLLGRHNALAGRGMYLSVVDRKKFRAEAQSVYEGILLGSGIASPHMDLAALDSA